MAQATVDNQTRRGEPNAVGRAGLSLFAHFCVCRPARLLTKAIAAAAAVAAAAAARMLYLQQSRW